MTHLLKLNLQSLALWLFLIHSAVTYAAESNMSLENAQWEVFTNRSLITTVLLSENSKILWVGTNGGLEKRDAETGEIRQIFVNTNGLPGNYIQALLLDNQGNLWVGTEKGLARYNTQQQWEMFNAKNSELPNEYSVYALLNDTQGNLWIGTSIGLVRYNQAEWQIFNTENSDLPSNTVTALLNDNQGGLWIGTGESYSGGLAHYDAQGQWQVFDTENSDLPNDDINVLSSDNQGNLWIGTNGGLARYTAPGEWQVFNTDNSDLPDNQVNALLKDNQGALWMVGTEGGLAYYYTTPKPRFEIRNLGLPSNIVKTLSADNQGNLWVGTAKGLTYYTATGQWEVLDRGNSDLPDSTISALAVDTQGNLWIGTTEKGLIRYNEKQRTWTTFNTQNSGFPGDGVATLLSDNQNGLWVGYIGDIDFGEGGLTHYTAQGQWEPVDSYPTDYWPTILLNDSEGGLWVGVRDLFSSDFVEIHYYTQGQWQTEKKVEVSGYVLISDGQGGLWIGGSSLIHHTAEGQQTVFHSNNSGLSGLIQTLLNDSQGGLWIGTDRGLIHFSAEGVWQKFNKENSGLPESYSVYNLLSDNEGGIWLGTNSGLVHHTAQGKWEILDFTNSNLPSVNILKLSSDNLGGLWIGTDKGLVHLRFSRKTELCQLDATLCQNLQINKRAAIIIAGGGSQDSNALWETTQFISNYLYNVLTKRGFDNNEIYYLTPKSGADFNGDDFEDTNIVDSLHPGEPLTIEDVRATFDWAKSQGKLDYPLYLFFIDHGDTDKLQLSKVEKMTAPEFKALLDDYQTVTGNEVILVIEACYSGVFAQQLTDNRFRRAFITSTNNTVAYFDRNSGQGFSRFFAVGIDKGMTFKEAFDYANEKQQNFLQGKDSELPTGAPIPVQSQNFEQIPQLNDGNNGEWLGRTCPNNFCITTGNDTLAIESTTTSSSVQVGQAVTLTAKTSGTIKRAWAVVRPPKMNFVLDTDGTPILAYPRVILEQTQAGSEAWQASWNDAVYNGNYSVTFYVEDNEYNIASSDLPLVLTVTGGVEPPPTAQVQLHLEKDRYQRGETFKATLTEDLGWGYDLYAAVLFPDGQNFMTLENTNELRPLNEAKPWYAQRKQGSAITLFDLTLPADLPTGEYCLFGILSPEQNEVFETLEKGLWVMDSKCLEIQ